MQNTVHRMRIYFYCVLVVVYGDVLILKMVFWCGHLSISFSHLTLVLVYNFSVLCVLHRLYEDHLNILFELFWLYVLKAVTECVADNHNHQNVQLLSITSIVCCHVPHKMGVPHIYYTQRNKIMHLIPQLDIKQYTYSESIKKIISSITVYMFTHRGTVSL